MLRTASPWTSLKSVDLDPSHLKIIVSEMMGIYIKLVAFQTNLGYPFEN